MSEVTAKLRKQLDDKKATFANHNSQFVTSSNNGPIGMDVAMFLFAAIESQAKEIEELKKRIGSRP
jgi:hypothetical protein